MDFKPAKALTSFRRLQNGRWVLCVCPASEGSSKMQLSLQTIQMPLRKFNVRLQRYRAATHKRHTPDLGSFPTIRDSESQTLRESASRKPMLRVPLKVSAQKSALSSAPIAPCLEVVNSVSNVQKSTYALRYSEKIARQVLESS